MYFFYTLSVAVLCLVSCVLSVVSVECCVLCVSMGVFCDTSFWYACGAMANLQNIQVSVYSLKPARPAGGPAPGPLPVSRVRGTS